MKNQKIKRIISVILAAVCTALLLAGCSTEQDDGVDMSYAINKISNKTKGDVFPGGYKLVNYSEENQGKHFANNSSKVIIRAGNGVEDFPELSVWAESTSAGIVISNITNNAADTNFGDPVEAKVCGFDAIYYDYEMIAYDFVENPDDPEGEPIKQEHSRYMGRNYYFYSDQDVYAVMFDTAKEDWEEQLPKFEEFVADLKIKKAKH